MNQRWSAIPVVLVLFVAWLLFVACGQCSSSGRHWSLESAAWDDYASFLRGVHDETLMADYPFLRRAPIYRLKLSVSDDLRRVSGVARVHYTNRLAETQFSLDFLLLPNLVPGTLTVGRVVVDGTEAESLLASNGLALTVTFPYALAAGESAVISVQYSLSVPQSTAVGFGALETSPEGLSLGYAYPMIPASGRWNRGRPPTYGDFTANPVSFYFVEISYPAGLVLAAPGVELSNVVHAGRATALIAFGPARDFYVHLGRGLALVERHANGIAIRAVVPPTEVAMADALLETAEQAISLFSALFAPYPYRTLTFVGQRFDAFGLEFPAIIELSSRLYGDPAKSVSGTPLRILREATVAHEVAHQWFYGLVGSDQLREPWIDESFAQYATLRYYSARYGEQGARGFRRSLEGRWAGVDKASIPLGGPVSSFTPREYSAVIYGRGPLFLLSLSERMGRPVFDDFLRQLNDTYRWRTVTGEDIRRLAERECGCSLEELWGDWVYPQQPATRPSRSP